MYLVLIETSGNQHYIFATNKLRENVGASELTYRSTTLWVAEAIGSLDGRDPQEILNGIHDPNVNPPAENGGIELVLASSGKAYVLLNTDDQAKQVIRYVTRKALLEAPGLNVTGAFVKLDWEKDDVHEAICRVHARLTEIRSNIPGPDSRFLRLPVTDVCPFSGRPAQVYCKIGDDNKRISRISEAKRNAVGGARDRLQKTLGFEFPADPDELERSVEAQRLAVIHADGNGLGRVFLDFRGRIGRTSNRDYITKLRNFSTALDECTHEACKQALTSVERDSNGEVRALPLVLGGDDLTLICLDTNALQFAEKFLEEFRSRTTDKNAIRDVLCGGVSACAGVAIVKPHYPFSSAYALAEDLGRSAKIVKKHYDDSMPPSALDFHVVYDSGLVDLDEARDRLTVDNGSTRLFGGPYLVDERPDGWAVAHQLQRLKDTARALLAKDEQGRRRLPNSQVHALRSVLFDGKAAADAAYKLIKPRYETLAALERSDGSLFSEESIDGRQFNVCSLIDAVEAAQLLER